MKTQIGGKWLRQWDGKPPQGRTMTPVNEHKGQAQEPAYEKYKIIQTKQGMTKVWTF